MKKVYVTPDMEVFRITLTDVILASPTEGTIPIGGNDDNNPTVPPEATEIPDF